MPENSKEERKDPESWDRLVIEAYRNAFSPLSRALSSILGLWTLACILGWKRADSYYQSIGTPWLTPKLDVSDLLSLSYWPTLAFAMGTLFAFTDHAENYSQIRKRSIFVVTAVVMLGYLAAGYWFRHSGDFGISARLQAMVLVPLAILVGSHFGGISLALSQNNWVWTSSEVWRIPFFAFTFLLSVGVLGAAEGERDIDIDQSKLARVSASGGAEARLLLIDGGVAYVAYLHAKEPPTIDLLEAEDISYITSTNAQRQDSGSQKAAIPKMQLP